MVCPYEKISLKVQGSTVESSRYEEFLGITTDNEITFNKHIISLWVKANQKLKRKILLKFIYKGTVYCPIIWMCHNRNLSNKDLTEDKNEI